MDIITLSGPNCWMELVLRVYVSIPLDTGLKNFDAKRKSLS